ncbi:RNA polymerase III transcription factor IIIC subunit-domain-containing protein [Truncatella angustata]|uniref:RNA polymerase III transcription factor IIIC subunit-domain-containing protein n=1 Tax=Truncatella angustata TaxID=152316 RepID=A0A9P8UFG0_9PEZI|nr:RNA polymerase III transcription factor IIIC subunit-domain-containing protein [Truncatella angustata]KAH6649005.1 RNA polymerase III transcription factor IIIC subunit-domain-containing protein [Truncatella angustata]KAH8200773.1 hypothetical protein TruAng_005090 [Truncatella angustata]
MLGLKDLFPKQGPKQNPNAAPYFEAPPYNIIAVEHPCIVKDVDNAMKTFGREPNFQRLLGEDTGRLALPLWFRPDVPTTKPIMSHNAASNNVVLKITVPRRTGRKRKRGSNEPFAGDIIPPTDDEPTERVSSTGREDHPKLILRKLQDTAGRYQAEAVGLVRDTHRYHSLADFQFSSSEMPYLTKVKEHFLSMKVDKLRELRFDPNLYPAKGQEIIPPPFYTDRVVPFNYFYEQNPYVRMDGVDEHGKAIMVNVQGRLAKTYGHYIEYNTYPVPDRPAKNLANSKQVPQDLLDRMRAALEERPIWTRRALIARVSPYYSENSLKIAVQLVGYQFKGGPWRDAVIKYGVDPRPDPSLRVYQTLAFKLEQLPKDSTVKNGVVRKITTEESKSSYLWDGTQYCTNGKFWQICDITDPTLIKMIAEAPLRDECDIATDGWWHGGTWAKIKAFMKAKMIAIRAGRLGDDGDLVPKKRGFLYDSDILQKLGRYADIQPQNTRGLVNTVSLLYGMEDVSGLEGLRYRHRPLKQFNDPLAAMGFRGQRGRKRREMPLDPDAPPQPDGDDDDSRPAAGKSQGGEEEEEEEEEEGEEGEDVEGDDIAAAGQNAPRGPGQFPDDAWAHILDSDLEDGAGGDSDGDGGEDDDMDESMLMPDEDEGGEEGDADADPDGGGGLD